MPIIGEWLLESANGFSEDATKKKCDKYMLMNIVGEITFGDESSRGGKWANYLTHRKVIYENRRIGCQIKSKSHKAYYTLNAGVVGTKWIKNYYHHAHFIYQIEKSAMKAM